MECGIKVCTCDYCGFILIKNVWVNMVLCVHVWLVC